MSTRDESENHRDDLSERLSAKGWRVLSNPTRRAEPETGELKALLRTISGKRRATR